MNANAATVLRNMVARYPYRFSVDFMWALGWYGEDGHPARRSRNVRPGRRERYGP